MLDTVLGHNLVSFLILEFASPVICSSLYDLDLKLIFGIDNEFNHH